MDEIGPLIGVRGKHVESRAHVLAALGVMGGGGDHGGGPGGLDALGPGVRLVRVEGEAGGVPADLGEAGQVHPAVEGRVLDSLGGDGPADLLEADDRLGAQRGVGHALAAHGLAEQERDDEVEGLGLVLLQSLAGALGRGAQDGRLLGVGRVPGDDVGAVAVGGHEQLDEAGVQVAQGVVAQAHVQGGEAVEDAGQPVDLGGQGAADDLPLGGLDDAQVVDGALPGELVHEHAQGS